MEVSHQLKEKSNDIKGITQLPYREIATALEIIPRTLAQNCGANVIRTMTMLSAKHAEGHTTFGINGLTGKVIFLTLDFSRI
jgi:T-complex protein 1 subunit gamma